MPTKDIDKHVGINNDHGSLYPPAQMQAVSYPSAESAFSSKIPF